MSSIQLAVGSKNPVKINAVQRAFTSLFSQAEICCTGYSTASGVADQPMSWQETRQGALNRLSNLQGAVQADYYVAIEGGVHVFTDGPATFAFIAISDGQRQSVGRSAQLPLPPQVYQALIAGEELGQVIDRLFNTDNAKQKQGAIGLLTQGHESRTSSYVQATTLALAPFLHPQLY